MTDLFIKLFPAAAAAICLAGLLAVTLRCNKLARAVASPQPKEDDSLSSIVAGLKWELASLADRLTALESEARETSAAVTIRSGMNLTKRTQALRQYRMGQASGEIAKSLEMPKAEVDLLLKVHRVVSR
jgi:hypothetical protein